MNLTLSDLIAGDILIFSNPFSMHVAIYAGETNGYPYICHATDSYTAKKNGVRITLLKEPESLEKIQVFRPNDPKHAHTMQLVMRQWAIDEVPFGHERTILWKTVSGLPCHSATQQQSFKRYCNLAYHNRINSYYRALKLAARGLHTTATKKGLHCTEAIIIASQIAAIAPHIYDIIGDDETPYTWISDKNGTDISEHYPEEYKQYLLSLTDSEHYDIPLNKRVSRITSDSAHSIDTWGHEQLLSKYCDEQPEVIKLEAKISSPYLLLRHLQAQSAWQQIGERLIFQQRPISPFSYQQWKLTESNFLLQSLARQKKYQQLQYRKQHTTTKIIVINPTMIEKGNSAGHKKLILLAQVSLILSLKPAIEQHILASHQYHQLRNPFWLMDHIMFNARQYKKQLVITRSNSELNKLSNNIHRLYVESKTIRSQFYKATCKSNDIKITPAVTI